MGLKFCGTLSMKFEVKSEILGFESVQEVSLEKIDEIFYTLKAKEFTFTLINAFAVQANYDFEISDETRAHLEIEDDSQIEIYSIVTVDSKIEKSTVNMLAPLIFNTKQAIMGQVVLNQYEYPFYQLNQPLKA